MSSSHDLKKLQYDGKDIVSEVAVRDDQGRIISSTYVDKTTDQTITGCKRFDTTPQIFDHYEITTKNLFRKNFNIFDNIGGTGTTYAYFKLPDDGKNYTLSVRLKDSTKSFGSGNVFGWSTYGGMPGGLLSWLAQGDTIRSQSHVFYANDAARCISLYYGNEDTFNKLLARYYIQLEEGTTMTEYVDPDSGVENIYVDAAKVNDIPTNVSQLTNDLGYITSSYHDNTKANQSSLNEVTAKIPSAADSNNQLADKAFVNSSIETATATFKGTYTTIAAIEALTADDNDYAFYQHVDSDGNTLFDRYKYNGTQWLYEYTLNNSSFTAAQWAAINSGVSADAWVNTSSAQVIDGQKDFNTVPTVRVESHKGAHNLPTEYQELQYISSLAGSGVISTTLAVDTATYYAVIRVSLINFKGSYGTIMGNNGAPQIAFNRTQWYVGNAGGNGQATPPAFNGAIYTLRYSYNGIGDYYVDNNDTGLRRAGSLGLTFFSNTPTGADNAAANIYIAEIYRRSDNELIYQFIPARSNSLNQLGFYETVNNIFYSGVGITAGPEDQSGEVIIQYLPVLTGGDFAPVAFTGSYNDLIGTPTIPIVNNGILTIQKNGTTVNTFTANQSSNVTVNITVPTDNDINMLIDTYMQSHYDNGDTEVY